jgi:hypothetical protein
MFNASTLTIRESPDSNLVELKVYKVSVDKEVSFCDTTTLNPTELISLTNFLKTYHSNTVTNTKALKRSKNLPPIIDLAGDAGDADVSLTFNGKKNRYHFLSVGRETEDGKLMAILLGIMERAFTPDRPFRYESYEYTRKLKRYF